MAERECFDAIVIGSGLGGLADDLEDAAHDDAEPLEAH